MKRVKVQQTIEYEIDVPDDWNRQTSLICIDTKDKEFSKWYDGIRDIEDCWNINTIEDKYYRDSVPDNLRIVHTKIL